MFYISTLALTIVLYIFFNWHFYIPFQFNFFLGFPCCIICLALMACHFLKECWMHEGEGKPAGAILRESVLALVSIALFLLLIYLIGETISGFFGKVLTTGGGWQSCNKSTAQGALSLVESLAILLVFIAVTEFAFLDWRKVEE
jgi:hypothetical protein